MNSQILSMIVKNLNSIGFNSERLTEGSYDIYGEGTKLGSVMLFKGELRYSCPELEAIFSMVIP